MRHDADLASNQDWPWVVKEYHWSEIYITGFGQPLDDHYVYDLWPEDVHGRPGESSIL